MFGEFAGLGAAARTLIIAGSFVMIAGAVAISVAAAPEAERHSWRKAMRRECERYGLREAEVEEALAGGDPLAETAPARRWWEFAVVALAAGVFVWLGWHAEPQPLAVDVFWLGVLSALSVSALVAGGWMLWRRTRFS